LAAARSAWIKEANNDPAAHSAREQSDFLREVDDSGRRFDFHSLRGQFVTSLARAGVHPRTAQKLARHKTLALTMENYTHADLADMSRALNTLPPMNHWPKNWPMAVDNGGQNVSSAVIMAGEGLSLQEAKNPLEAKGLDAVCQPISSPDIVRLMGLEPMAYGLKAAIRPRRKLKPISVSPCLSVPSVTIFLTQEADKSPEKPSVRLSRQPALALRVNATCSPQTAPETGLQRQPSTGADNRHLHIYSLGGRVASLAEVAAIAGTRELPES
jgi:hypothetical protein